MAPRAPRCSAAAAAANTLNQPRGRAIRKPKLSKTPISDVFVKACQEEDFEKIRACLTLGVDINSRGSDNNSALCHSLWYGNEKIFDFLVGHPDLDVDQINREEILRNVCVSGREDSLRKLCNLPGIDVNAGRPLYFAAWWNNVAAINILAENPALDWNAGDCIPYTPIGVAVEKGYFDIVERLLSEPSLDLSRIDKYE